MKRGLLGGLEESEFLHARINEISRALLHWTLAKNRRKCCFLTNWWSEKCIIFYPSSFEVELNSLPYSSIQGNNPCLHHRICSKAGDCAIFAHLALFFLGPKSRLAYITWNDAEPEDLMLWSVWKNRELREFRHHCCCNILHHLNETSVSKDTKKNLFHAIEICRRPLLHVPFLYSMD